MKKHSILALALSLLLGSAAHAQMNYYAGGTGTSAAGFNAVANHWNLGIGQASQSNTPGTSGFWNTSAGSGSLENLMAGSNNTAFGGMSLLNNMTGSDNTAVGYLSTQSNTGGSYNSSLGSEALATTFSNGSTAMGYRALTNSFTGTNDAFGDSTLYNVSTGVNNVAIGRMALFANTADNNTALGYQALAKVTTGTGNTGLGYGAGFLRTGYSYCTFVGWAADATGSHTNSTSLGFNAYVSGSNTIQLGNTAITSIKGYGSTTITSDQRVKKDIKDNVPGIAFIRSLHPVTYHYDMHKMDQMVYGDRAAEYEKTMAEGIAAKEKILYSGFLAQEVETAAQKLGYDFSAVQKPQNDKDLYSISYAEFVVPLVKGVQEQQDMIDAQAKTISKQQDMIDAQAKAMAIQQESIKALSAKVEAMSSQVSDITDCCRAKNADYTEPSAHPQLFNAVPNPASKSTTIYYSLPASYGTASIQLTDMSGKVNQTVALSGSGNSSVKLDLGNLSGDTYLYTLVVDGKMADSKKLTIISK